MGRTFSLVSFVSLVSLVSLGGCVDEDTEAGHTEEAEIESSTDQAVTAPPFRLKSTVFTNQLVAPLSLQQGQIVALLVQGGFSTEAWRFENQQLISNANPTLCLQAASTNPGATVIVARCIDPFDITQNPPQFWKLRLRPNGNARYENLVSRLYLDGSASNGVLRTQPLSGLPAQDFKRVF